MKGRNTLSTLESPSPIQSSTVDLNNIQGDVIFGLQKRFELYVFFEIVRVDFFRDRLRNKIYDLITNSRHVADFDAKIRKHKLSNSPGYLSNVGVNVAFSAKGLEKMSISSNLGDGDTVYSGGQLSDAPNLGDDLGKWEAGFKGPIHLVFLVASDRKDSAEKKVDEIKAICTPKRKTQTGHNKPPKCSIQEIVRVEGNVRPGAERGHEHFGFNDGLSQPAIDGLGKPYKGVQVVPPGIILVKNTGDPNLTKRPDWTKDGSFMVFRKLKQLVPEFDDFLAKNPIPEDPNPVHGSEMLGARMMGRWKSGTSVDMSPMWDNLAISSDPNKVNDFDYTDDPNEIRCPFAAHLRKTNPRHGAPTNFTDAVLEKRRIIRNGIPYGPEVSPKEKTEKKTSEDRGLAFTCYQSVIANGFRFIQQTWADNVDFAQKGVGFDPIIGQNQEAARTTTAMNPWESLAPPLALPMLWVIPKGGEYFFSPSLKAIKDTLGKNKTRKTTGGGSRGYDQQEMAVDDDDDDDDDEDE